MQELHELRLQIQRMNEQMSSDDSFTALALKSLGQTFRATTTEIAQRIDFLGREMEERFNQVEGRVRLQEQRLSLMLTAVDSSLALVAHKADDWESLSRRVEALERKIDPAA